MDEAQARIKIVGRNINSLRYEEDTTLMEECEEELKSFLRRVKEDSEKANLKLDIRKMKTQMTIISTTVGRNPSEEMEQLSLSTKESKMQYLDAIS